MSAEQLEQLLTEAKRYADKHFDVDLVYRDLDVIAIDSLFSNTDPEIVRDSDAQCLRVSRQNQSQQVHLG